MARRATVVERGNFKTWLIDTGYGADTTYSLEELRALAPCRIEEILRLEPLIERLIGEAESMDDFLDAYGAALDDLRGRGIVGLKSVIAYRTGLHVAPTLRVDAADGVRLTRATWLARGPASGSSRSRCSTTSIVIAVEEAARQSVPIQFHTGLGDPDLDLTLVDPAALRFLFSERFRGRADRAAPHRLPVRPLARVLRRDVPQRVRRHGRVDPVRGRRGDPDLPRAAGPRAGEQAPVLDRRVARPGAVLDRRAARAAGARRESSTSTSPRAPSTSGPRSTGPSGSCGATPRPSTGSERARSESAAAAARRRAASGRRRNSRSSGTSRWPRMPSRRTVMTTMKITARMIPLRP